MSDSDEKETLISVVLPVYNGQKFLAEAIESVINQTYQNWELIIVDDCSTDNSPEIMQEYARKDKRIKVIRNEKNLKLPASLNTGFRIAAGEFYTWTSDDNYYYPQAFEKMLAHLLDNPEDGMVYAVCKVFGMYEDFWGNIPCTPELLLRNPIPGACFLYRKSIACKIGEYDQNIAYAEDHDYWLRLFLEAPIGHIYEELYAYRRHAESLTVTSNDRAAVLRKHLFNKYLPLYRKKFPELKEKFIEKIFSLKNNKNTKIFKFLGFKIKMRRFNLKKIKFTKNKPTLAMQVNTMDKGGLEEVVLQLANDEKIREKYNIILITANKNKGYLANIARKNGIPVIPLFYDYNFLRKVIEHFNIEIVHFHYDLFGVKAYKFYGIKTIYTIHNNYIWMDTADVKLRNKSYAFIDKLAAVSSQVKDYFCEKFSAQKDKVQVITNGVEIFDDSQIASKKKTELGFNENDFVFINVASLNPLKYHFTQAYALAKLKDKYPNIKLLILGNILNNEYYKQFLNFIKKYNIEKNIKILDYVPKDEVFAYLKMADCFIMTSLSEGFSIAMTEAMFLQKPMIISDVGGAKDAVENNDIGIVVRHAFDDLQKLNLHQIIENNKEEKYHFNNAQEIINAMEDMFLNKEVWTEKAKGGRIKVVERFNTKEVCGNYLNLYNELAQDNAPKTPVAVPVLK